MQAIPMMNATCNSILMKMWNIYKEINPFLLMQVTPCYSITYLWQLGYNNLKKQSMRQGNSYKKPCKCVQANWGIDLRIRHILDLAAIINLILVLHWRAGMMSLSICLLLFIIPWNIFRQAINLLVLSVFMPASCLRAVGLVSISTNCYLQGPR